MFFGLDSQSQNLRKGRRLVKNLHFDFGKTKFNVLQNNFSFKTPPIKRRNADDDNDDGDNDDESQSERNEQRRQFALKRQEHYKMKAVLSSETLAFEADEDDEDDEPGDQVK